MKKEYQNLLLKAQRDNNMLLSALLHILAEKANISGLSDAVREVTDGAVATSEEINQFLES